jgi:hypothetical protein
LRGTTPALLVKAIHVATPVKLINPNSRKWGIQQISLLFEGGFARMALAGLGDESAFL